MAWGLGFLEDLVGKENIAAAQKVYDRTAKGLGDVAASTGETLNDAADSIAALKQSNSQKKKDGNAWYNQVQDSVGEVVDDAGRVYDKASSGLQDTYNDLSYTANAIGDRYNADKAAYEARIAAEIANDNNSLPTPEEQALRETSEVFMPVGHLANKGVTAIGNGLGKLVAKAPQGSQLTRRSLDDVANMTQDAGDIAMKQANASRNVYGQDMTKAKFAFDDAARQVATKDGVAEAARLGEIRMANDVSRKANTAEWKDYLENIYMTPASVKEGVVRKHLKDRN